MDDQTVRTAFAEYADIHRVESELVAALKPKRKEIRERKDRLKKVLIDYMENNELNRLVFKDTPEMLTLRKRERKKGITKDHLDYCVGTFCSKNGLSDEHREELQDLLNDREVEHKNDLVLTTGKKA